ncbi:hypothetical protein O9992_27190 [Vibrio lentus]|nr:hypothetical protein [Vibrio lentus]
MRGAVFEMMYDYVYNCPIGGTAIRIKPANDQSTQALKQCREALKAATGNNFDFDVTITFILP